MDISGAHRTAAISAAAVPSQVAATATVAGNAEVDDPLLSRVAGETEAVARSADGDNTELRAGQHGAAGELSAEYLALLQDLRARDREVRSHELAHLAAAGRHARGGPSFTFEPGPDGRRYAVAGEVGIDTSEVAGDPAATLVKAQQIRRAALAPADPSAQDRQIAAQAAAMATQARAEIAAERRESDTATTSPAAAQDVNQPYPAATEQNDPLFDLVA